MLLFVAPNTLFLNAQSLTVYGNVTDSLGNSLSYVNVLLKSGGETIDFTTTDNEGAYLFDLPALGKYSLSLSYIGYHSQIEVVEILSQPTQLSKNFILNEKTELLRAVTVVGEKLQARIKNDTISYNVDLVSNGTEENLGELMDKLPGVDVDADGKVLANGKKIDHFLVNGQKFFDNQEQLATKNLSAEMVSKIDLINNYKTNENLSLQNSGETALNIELKEDYVGKLTGNLKGQGGLIDKGLGHANLFYFNDKLNFSFVGDVNNLGESALSLQDYIALKGGIGKFKEDHNNNVNVADTELPEFVISNDENRIGRESYFTGLNLSYTPTERVKINSHSFFNKIRESRLEETDQEIVFTGGRYFNNTSQELDLDIFNSQLEINIQPSSKTLLKYQVDFLDKKDKVSQVQDLFGDFSNQLNERFNTAGKDFTQRFTFDLKKELLWRFSLEHSYKLNHRIYNLQADRELFEAFYNVEKFVQKRTANNSIFGINGGFEKEFKETILSFSLSSQLDDQRIENTLMSDSIAEHNSILLRNWISSATIGLSKNQGKIQYKLSLSSNFWKQNIFRSRNNIFLSPLIFGKYEFSSAQYISVRYAFKPSLNGLNEMTDFTFIKDFRTLNLISEVNPNAPLLDHSVGATYYNFDLFSGRLAVFTLNLSQMDNAISKNINPGFFYDTFSWVNDNSKRNLTAFGIISQKIKKPSLTATLKGTYTFTEITNYIERIESKLIVEKLLADFDLTTNLKKALLNYSLGVEFDRTTTLFEANSLENVFIRLNPYGVIKFIDNSEKFVGVVKMGWRINTTRNDTSSPFILSPRVSYKLNKNFTLSIKGDNVFYLSSQKRVETSSSETFIVNRYFYPLPGYLTLGLKYDFK